MNNRIKGTKGAGNKGKGRPKGAKNKTTKDLKEFINNLLIGNLDLLNEDFKTLQPFQRLQIFEKLLRYVIAPEMKTKMDFSQLTENQINAIIDNLNN